MSDKSPENPPLGAFYKPSAYAPVVGWPVVFRFRHHFDEVDGLATQCKTCGLLFAQMDGEQCLLCREKPDWRIFAGSDGEPHERWVGPTDFAFCPECKKPFLHNDMFPENGDESGVFACEPCVNAKIQSGEWRECKECGYCYEQGIECRHSAEVEGDSHDNEEQCCQCGEWVDFGELDNALECVDCRTQLDTEEDPGDFDEPGGPDDPLEQCVRCGESLLPGQLDGFGHCPDCREGGDDEDE